jgi:hypothetical protein
MNRSLPLLESTAATWRIGPTDILRRHARWHSSIDTWKMLRKGEDSLVQSDDQSARVRSQSVVPVPHWRYEETLVLMER